MPMPKGHKHTAEAKAKIGRASLGRKFSSESIKRFSKAKRGNKNPNWQGVDAGYVAVHFWIRRHKQKPEGCEFCGKTNRRMDWAYKDHARGIDKRKYSRKFNMWIYLCRSCHMRFDGRILNLNRGKTMPQRRYNMKTQCDNCQKETADFIGSQFTEAINAPGAQPGQFKTSIAIICGDCRALKRVI